MVNHLTVKAIRESGRKIPFIVVITDPVTLHRAWVVPEVDMAIVATEEAKELAVQYGMPLKKIKVKGMPIDPKFFLRGSERSKKKGSKFTVLLMGGGEGGGGMHKIIKEFQRQKFDGEIIVIAGRNKLLENKLRKEAGEYDFSLRVFGFTDQVYELMSESDIIITKAGPGTIAEALAMNLPIIITSWLPGQEEGNVDFVLKEKVGKVCKDPQKIVETVKEIQNPARLKEMKRNIKRVSRPKAALEIAREIYNFF